jgi:hypothetical protein
MYKQTNFVVFVRKRIISIERTLIYYICTHFYPIYLLGIYHTSFNSFYYSPYIHLSEHVCFAGNIRLFWIAISIISLYTYLFASKHN